MTGRFVMTPRLFATGLAATGAALTIGAAPSPLAAPAEDNSPPCVQERTCTTLVPKTTRYLRLTPASALPAGSDPQ